MWMEQLQAHAKKSRGVWGEVCVYGRGGYKQQQQDGILLGFWSHSLIVELNVELPSRAGAAPSGDDGPRKRHTL